MPKYRSKDVEVEVIIASHGGKIANLEILGSNYQWVGEKFIEFKDGDYIVKFSDGVNFSIHPEFGKRILQRVEPVSGVRRDDD